MHGIEAQEGVLIRIEMIGSAQHWNAASIFNKGAVRVARLKGIEWKRTSAKRKPSQGYEAHGKAKR